jgi:hypothetical protein
MPGPITGMILIFTIVSTLCLNIVSFGQDLGDIGIRPTGFRIGSEMPQTAKRYYSGDSSGETSILLLKHKSK